VLTLYGLLPIVRSTIVGITGIDPSIRLAGLAMGMTPRQLLRQIELPLALPSIVAGIRVAAVVGVGSATIAAAIGAGGSAVHLSRPVDGGLDGDPCRRDPRGDAGAHRGRQPAMARAPLVGAAARRSRRAVVAAAASLAIVVLAGSALWATRSPGAIVVGSKNFTEQLILGEILAQAVERETGLPVQRRLNLGGTLICDRALITGDIDVYVEYTGTALTAIFHQPAANDPKTVTETVRDLYSRSGRTLLPALGYDNTFAILVRGDDARTRGLRTIDDAARVAPQWRAGFGYEFLERPDGYAGLAKTYGLTFRSPPQVMDLSLSYRALASGQVDLIAGDATAGLIKGLDLFQLEDNRRYFPPYDAFRSRAPRLCCAIRTCEKRSRTCRSHHR
jgi:osmoprotectant transport system permease protein